MSPLAKALSKLRNARAAATWQGSSVTLEALGYCTVKGKSKASPPESVLKMLRRHRCAVERLTTQAQRHAPMAQALRRSGWGRRWWEAATVTAARVRCSAMVRRFPAADRRKAAVHKKCAGADVKLVVRWIDHLQYRCKVRVEIR